MFEASRYDFEGEDRAKIERVQKFYSAIPEVVELRPYRSSPPAASRRISQRRPACKLDSTEIGLLVESLAADAGRIANEIEKLSLYTGGKRKVTAGRYSAAGSERSGLHYFRAGWSFRTRRSKAIALQPGHAAARRRVPAPGLDLPLYAVPAGYGRARIRAQNLAADPGTFHTGRYSHLARSSRAGAADHRCFPKRETGVRHPEGFWADEALRDTRPDDRMVMEELVLSLTN